MQTKVILIHHHIFKNAGNSFNYALNQYFKNTFFKFDLPKSQIVTRKDIKQFILEHPQALAISSHHACMPTPKGKNYRTISSVILRQPLARIESIYKFGQKQKENKANELSFKEYVLWRLEKTPNMFCNYQTYYCSRSEKSQFSQIPNDESLEKAIANLKKCFLVGTVENYQNFLEFSQQKLRRFYPDIILKYSFRNKTSVGLKTIDQVKLSLVEKLGEELVAEIENRNQLDYELYRKAQTIEELYSRKSDPFSA